MNQIKINIEINNLDQYKKLLMTAKAQAKQLHETIELIENFDFKVQVVV